MLRTFDEDSEEDPELLAYNPETNSIQPYLISDFSYDFGIVLKQFAAIYGYMQGSYSQEGDDSAIVLGVKYPYTEFVQGDKFDRFDTLGLCQGILQIYDEEQEAIIANAVWDNGTLYVPVYTADGGLKTCARNLQLSEESAIAPLSQMIENSSRCFYGSIDGITYDDLTDVLSESGLTIKPVEIAIDASASVELPGLRLACDTTQLWLNG